MSPEKQPPATPDEKKKILHIKWYWGIEDPQIIARTNRLCQTLGVSPTELFKDFLTLGLIVAKLEDDPQRGLVEYSLISGVTTKVNLRDQEISRSPVSFTQILRTLISTNPFRYKVTASILIEKEINKLAERYHIAKEEVVKKMLILGIKCAESSLQPDKAYYLVDKESGTNQLVTFSKPKDN